MCIHVVNKKRGGKGEYIGRPSPLGNPFAIGRDGDREEVIAKYRGWIRQKIRAKDPQVCGELNRLYKLAKAGELSLVCWCAPLACHGDVVREILEEKL